MLVWFRCEKEDFTIGLETDTKPCVGDSVYVDHRDYDVEKVIWCLEKAPAQSGLLIRIAPHD